MAHRAGTPMMQCFIVVAPQLAKIRRIAVRELLVLRIGYSGNDFA
jgi:hypothetical protein